MLIPFLCSLQRAPIEVMDFLHERIQGTVTSARMFRKLILSLNLVWYRLLTVDCRFFSRTANPDTSIHFWTPCHATPYYSYLHQNVSMWFPDCSPA